MASAFKNFLITFVICLLVFGFLGLNYGIDFLNSFKFSDENESSVVVEESQPDDTTFEDDITSTPQNTVPDNIKNPDGGIFTAVVMTVDSVGAPVDMVFIDANAQTEKYVYCTIPVETTVKSENGATTTAKDLFPILSNEQILQCVTAMTGIETEYFMVFDRDSLISISENMPGARIELDSPITYTPEGSETAVYINDTGDGVLLSERHSSGKSNAELLLGYTPEGQEKDQYNVLYSKIASALIKHFFEREADTNNDQTFADIIGAATKTNITLDIARHNAEAIFSYDNFARLDMTYPKNSRDTAIKTIRNADGRY